MNQEAMDALRAADPAMRARLDGVDPGALDALRRRIVMTDQTEKRIPDRKRWNVRRGLIVGGVAAVLVGSGVAYATDALHLRFGVHDGLACESAQDENLVAGPWLTGDAVADCDKIRAEAGVPPIEDPVVIEQHGSTAVLPADQVPDGARVLDSPQAISAAVLELETSLGDWVDGGVSVECRSTDAMVDWVESDLHRLGLTDWKVTTQEREVTDGQCTFAFVGDGSEVVVGYMTEEASEEPPASNGHGPSAMPMPSPSSSAPSPSGEASPSADGEDPANELGVTADALRSGITDQCVSLSEARALVDQTLASLPYEPFPTTSIADESADCARVDMRVGGNVQVTVYGPPTVG